MCVFKEICFLMDSETKISSIISKKDAESSDYI